jgi:hypothetical protein
MPTLADKSAFLPSVLQDATFQKEGVLFGTDDVEFDCQWVVVDPNRHRMSVWKKPYLTADFVETAKTLKASVFTDGTLQHSRYEGSKVTSAVGYFMAEVEKPIKQWGISWGVSSLKDKFTGIVGETGPAKRLLDKLATDAEDTMKRNSDDETDASWFIAGRYGRVIGRDKATPATARGGLPIDDTVSETNPTLGYFGRKAGDGFDSYEIGKGEPPATLLEAAGGLYGPTLLENKVTPDSFPSNMWFYWALAPLKPQAKDTVLAEALAAYVKASPKASPRQA